MADFTGGPGFLAFVATFVLVGGVILLSRSLSKHLRKVRTHPPEHERAVATEASAAQGDAAAAEATEVPEAPSATPDDEASKEP
ncbi:hypothetical protein [Demequina activiva]|uniref:Uncharacterized protein n=1 Tax=Demequina activiva TaxID=1582364 RepID=A0A919Q396_9MICO|nr:hypothetical protein [Demequina activiva]GIG53633.1 hypothetical protein Dac01nite_03850 [Demequina activiva]